MDIPTLIHEKIVAPVSAHFKIMYERILSIEERCEKLKNENRRLKAMLVTVLSVCLLNLVLLAALFFRG